MMMKVLSIDAKMRLMRAIPRLWPTSKFTLIELMVVMVIISIGFVGVTTITSVGIDVGIDAIAESITVDAGEQFLRFNAKMIRDDPSWLELFPETKIEHDDSEMNEDTELTWSNTTFVESESHKVRFVTTYDQQNEEFEPDSQKSLDPDEKQERSVYLCEQLAQDYKKFLVSIRAWRQIPKEPDDDFGETIFFVEASYPATMPYNTRHKKVFSIPFYKVPEIAVEDEIEEELP